MREIIWIDEFTNVPKFKALERTPMSEELSMAAVDLDQDTYDFGHLINQPVAIDGIVYECVAVERRAHAAPWRKGERIGLVVK